MGATCNLIVNADDFGRTFGVNQGVIKTHELGIVTAASLMVRWPAATEAASYSRTHEDLSIGLHFDFGEWFCRNGTWSAVYEVVGPNESVREEAFRQVEAFRTLIGTTRPTSTLTSTSTRANPFVLCR
jgi:chitin disaccharide deacetylase